MLRKKLSDNQTLLEELRSKDFKKREEELTVAIDEVQTDEERKTVESEIEQFETEKSETETQIADLEAEILRIEHEIQELETKKTDSTEMVERNKDKKMSVRTKFFGLTLEERDLFLNRSEVKGFLQRVREFKGQKRAVTGSELLIPEVMLELLRDHINRYSKLISKVNLRNVNGKARQNLVGTIPEAVWTEACATLNELSFSFHQIELDGYKVGGYIAICNATLEDSDLNLASEILNMIGQAIGLALDKAILYGTGVKMPLGIATRLAQESQPAYWNQNAPAWKDLHTTNILKVSSATLKGEELFSELVLHTTAAKSNYSSGTKFWAMNASTWATLQSKLITFNSAGAVVSSMNQTMPIIGGDIVTLDFIPDGDIIGGYGSLYLLLGRAGMQLAQSEHVMFIEDNTVFKGTARYDGAPVLGQGFVMINIKGQAPTTTMTFAPDTANTDTTEFSLSPNARKKSV